MDSKIMTLSDECISHIFRKLDFLNIVAAAQVCQRWKELAQKELDEIKILRFNNIEECRICHPMISTNINKIKAALKYFGPQVKTVELGECRTNIIGFSSHYYKIVDNIEPKRVISILSQTCNNILDLYVGTIYFHLKQFPRLLLKSSTKLKKLYLPEGSMCSFSKRDTFDSVEELIWEINDLSLYNFRLPFPNLRKITLVLNITYKHEDIIKRVFIAARQLKSLSIDLTEAFMSKGFFDKLCDINAIFQLEELEIRNDNIDDNNQSSIGSAFDLISSCPNLRVLKFDTCGFKAINVAHFLKLPKLEHLAVKKVAKFKMPPLCRLRSTLYENLSTLALQFDEDKTVDLYHLIITIKILPVLKKVFLFSLPHDESLELTYATLNSGILRRRDIWIMLDRFNYLIMHENGVQQTTREPLILWCGCQNEFHEDEIVSYMLATKDCKIWRYKNDEDILKGVLIERLEIFDCCSCRKYREKPKIKYFFKDCEKCHLQPLY